MRVLPILFNGDMVRAILDGRKTVTRRIVKKQPEISLDGTECECRHEKGFYDMGGNNWVCRQCGYGVIPMRGGSWIHALYQPGDILYVRETFIQAAAHTFWYKADDNSWMPEDLHWHPSIHMPKEAARIWLKVTNVRAERLQDITEDSAEAEGCFDYTSTALGFPDVWNSTIKKSDLDRYGWDASPWVWVIEFERCEKPEEV